jgi:hypothetical protein
VDGHGRALHYNGSTWTAPTQIDAEGGLESVSCPAEAFCMATGGRQHGYALTYDGSGWSTPSTIDPEGDVNAVSCPTASFCVALAEHFVENHELGYALTYKNGAWSAPSEIDTELALRSVSCASESFCVAVGRHDALIYSNGSWGPPQQIYTEGNLWSVSCVSFSFCVAVTEHFEGIGPPAYGEALVYDGSRWSAPTEIPRLPDHGWIDAGSVSCASTSFCMAIPRFDGAAAIFENGVWGAWDELEINGGFSSVSCVSGPFCMVVNGAGQAFRYGTAPTNQDSGGITTDTVAATAPPTVGAPIEKHKPLVNGKTGEITLEYEFPEAGDGEAYGEVGGRAVVASRDAAHADEHRRSETCRSSRHSGNQPGKRHKKCVENAPVRYGRVKLRVPVAGIYKVHVKPSGKVLAALKRGNTLNVRIVLVFMPAGTSVQIHRVSTIRVKLARRRTRSL